MGEVVTRLCFCAERLDAAAANIARFSPTFGGWVWRDVPTRSMSKVARYYAFIERGAEFPHEDHTGEPVVYHCCPHCGGLLPGVRFAGDDAPPFFQADGEG